MGYMTGIDRALLHKINTEILHSILKKGEKYNLKHLLKLLREYLGADIGFWFFIDGSVIMSMILDESGGAGVRLPLSIAPPEIDASGIPEVPRLFQSSLTALYGGEKLSSSLRIPLYSEDRSLIAVIEFGSYSGVLPRNRAAQVIGITRYLHNIYDSVYSDMRRFETNRKLRSDYSQTERQFRVLLENTHDIVLSFSPDGRILTVNDVGRRALSLGENPESWIFDPVSPDMRFIIDMVKDGHAAGDIEVILGDEKSGVHYFLASFSPEMDIHNNVVVVHGIFKDISERVESQKSLWETNLELSQAKQLLESTQLQMVQQEKLASIGQLAAGVAHEINNPLGFIMSNHETLKEYLGKILRYIDLLESSLEGAGGKASPLRAEAKAGKALERVSSLVEDCDEGFSRITKIIQSLKDFSRTESRGELSPVFVEKLLEDTLNVSRNSWKYVAEATTDFKLNSPVEAYGDLLNQVFMNIIVNAAQAIQGQGRTELGAIRIETRREGNEAVIIISDDGPGIPEEHMRKLFDPFFTTKPIGQGTGLGLSVSYDIIVKKHAGVLSAENSPEGGARFIIRIPMEQPRDSLPVEEEL